MGDPSLSDFRLSDCRAKGERDMERGKPDHAVIPYNEMKGGTRKRYNVEIATSLTWNNERCFNIIHSKFSPHIDHSLKNNHTGN